MNRSAWLGAAYAAFFCFALLACNGAESALSASDGGTIVSPSLDQITEIEALVATGDFGKALAVAHRVPLEHSTDLTGWIERNFDGLIPLFGYELANRTYQVDQKTALRWFYISDLRARYDAMRCKDPSSRQLVDVMKRELAGDVLKSLTSHKQDIPAAAQQALMWDKDRMPSYVPWWVCTHGALYGWTSVQNLPSAKKDLLIPESEWRRTREETRASLKQFIAEVKAGHY